MVHAVSRLGTDIVKVHTIPAVPSRSDYFFELFRDLPKQGAGSDLSTGRALAFLRDLPAEPRILDIGCGSGRQTLALLGSTGGRVTAVDTHQESLDRLAAAAQEAHAGDRVETRCESMDALDFPAGSFDLIWCEGAIYNVGFQTGLEMWRPLLRDGGSVGISELTWLNDRRPQPVVDFLANAYPGMGSLAENRKRSVDAGYQPLGGFVLPDEDWWDGYYDVLEARIAEQRPDAIDAEHLEVLDGTQTEIDLFRTRQGSYGYAFYLLSRLVRAR
ncbi:MAG: class I SAM-dependent methyltransferase [Acidobacteriota bacterium]|nr:class I SAM-dependent methyltransferase [Acidobacteriota bacterium]